MDRYKIAIEKFYKAKSKAFKFPPTNSAIKIVKYIKYCIMHDGSFVATNMPLGSLETAIIQISRLTDTPILVSSQKKARILSTAYSHKQIYYPDHLPVENILICYDCNPPDNYKSYVSIFSV
jgi:hypothetical protein